MEIYYRSILGADDRNFNFDIIKKYPLYKCSYEHAVYNAAERIILICLLDFLPREIATIYLEPVTVFP